ncbi:uncharacterized protein LOC126892916 [Diabrotica virgifera virgifera]|uniref:Uncharacterized protein n=1 Tax=Diabrotica virgifera virgifera TaxID=50390 RepID=A0ABM5L8M1_DIAVI|nr:uncharacterized protein LOC126892916 [Diabrotica virgifera virgifera]
MKCCFIIICCLLFAVGLSAVIENQTNNPASLPNSFFDIVKEIPREKVTEIAKDHLQNDEGFKSAIKYMKSAEWKKLIETIKVKPEWVNLKAFMTSFGVPIDTIIKCAEKFVQNVTITDVPEDTPRNLTSFIRDVEKVIQPAAILIKITKLQKNPQMAGLIQQIKTPETKAKFDEVLHIPEIQTVLDELKKMGLCLYNLISLMYYFFGWGEFKQ